MRRGDIETTRLFIGGKWTAPDDGHYAEITNPATEETVGSVAIAGDAELDGAVTAARGALDGAWGKLSGLERGMALLRLAEAIEKNLDGIARAQVLEMGKTIQQSRLEIRSVLELLQYHAGWASKLDGSVREVPGGFHTFVIHEPVGVVAAITPFNVPIYLMATKLAVALAAGCTFVHKPATATSLSAVRFAEAVEKADMPAGVYNLVTGSGSKLGKAISTHRGIDKIAFTGSTEVGIQIVKDSAESLKKVTMELGGKSPNIVLADADVEIASTNAMLGNFLNSGQICTSGSRLIIERPVYDELLEALIKKLEVCKIGDPMQEDTFFGPVADAGAHKRILGYIDQGKAEGARLVHGGEATKVDGKGFYIQPTVFADAENTMTIAREEIFGPVLTVIPVADVDEAIRVGNDTSYGLASAVQTTDMNKALKVARALKAGVVWVNTEYQWSAAAPYGGVKMSGYGRENGREAYDAYLQPKTVWIPVHDEVAASSA